MDSPHPISVSGKQHKRRPCLSSVGRGEEPGVLLSDRGACPHPGGGGGLRRPAPGCPQTSFLPSWPRHLHLSGNTLLLSPSPVCTLHLLSFPPQLWPAGRGLRRLGRLPPAAHPQLPPGHDRKGQGRRRWGSRRPGAPALPASLPPCPPSAPLPSFPGRQTLRAVVRARGDTCWLSQTPSLYPRASALLRSPHASRSAAGFSWGSWKRERRRLQKPKGSAALPEASRSDRGGPRR